MSKRDAIIQAVVTVVAIQGIADTPTIRIAREAGSAENTIFRLFGNKRKLLHDTFDEILGRIHIECRPIIAEVVDPESAFVSVMRKIVDYYRKNPEELAFVMEYVNSSIGAPRRPDIRYENGDDMSAYPVVSLLGKGKKEKVFKELSMTALVGLSVVPLLMFLREEQIRNIRHSDADCQLLISACLESIKT